MPFLQIDHIFNVPMFSQCSNLNVPMFSQAMQCGSLRLVALLAVASVEVSHWNFNSKQTFQSLNKGLDFEGLGGRCVCVSQHRTQCEERAKT